MDRIVFFLNGTRGMAVLAQTLYAGHEVIAVVAPANRPLCKELATLAKAKDLKIEQIDSVNGPAFINSLREMVPSVSVIAGFSMILKEDVINVPIYGTINLHAGRLPQYRGGSPLNWQLINDETEAEINVIQVDTGIDTGDILARSTFPIEAGDTIADLHKKANDRFPELLVGVLDEIDKGTLNPRPQDDLQASYWHQRSDADGRLRFDSMPAETVGRLVRAVTRPYPGAWCYMNDKRLRIFDVELVETLIRGTPGRVLWLEGKGPYIICEDRAILITDYAIEKTDVEKLSHGIQLH